jgi:hypothetical protein
VGDLSLGWHHWRVERGRREEEVPRNPLEPRPPGLER